MSVTCYLYDRKEKYDVDSLNGREVIIVYLTLSAQAYNKMNKTNTYEEQTKYISKPNMKTTDG